MGKRLEKARFKTAVQGDEDRNLPGCVWNKSLNVSMPYDEVLVWLFV